VAVIADSRCRILFSLRGPTLVGQQAFDTSPQTELSPKLFLGGLSLNVDGLSVGVLSARIMAPFHRKLSRWTRFSNSTNYRELKGRRRFRRLLNHR
jgi:hypothetical protein